MHTEKLLAFGDRFQMQLVSYYKSRIKMKLVCLLQCSVDAFVQSDVNKLTSSMCTKVHGNVRSSLGPYLRGDVVLVKV